MVIGTVREEEARVSDGFAGYHEFHAEETQAAYGSFEVFWSGLEWSQDDPDAKEPDPAGWYWWACFPGCLPDGDPMGPFASSRLALEDADEWHPEFDRE